MFSPPDETSVNFPPEISLRPHKWESDSLQFKKRNFVICPGCLMGQDLNHNTF